MLALAAARPQPICGGGGTVAASPVAGRAEETKREELGFGLNP